MFLLSIRAGGVGLNLQAADTVIMYDTGENRSSVCLQRPLTARRNCRVEEGWAERAGLSAQLGAAAAGCPTCRPTAVHADKPSAPLHPGLQIGTLSWTCRRRHGRTAWGKPRR